MTLNVFNTTESVTRLTSIKTRLSEVLIPSATTPEEAVISANHGFTVNRSLGGDMGNIDLSSALFKLHALRNKHNEFHDFRKKPHEEKLRTTLDLLLGDIANNGTPDKKLLISHRAHPNIGPIKYNQFSREIGDFTNRDKMTGEFSNLLYSAQRDLEHAWRNRQSQPHWHDFSTGRTDDPDYKKAIKIWSEDALPWEEVTRVALGIISKYETLGEILEPQNFKKACGEINHFMVSYNMWGKDSNGPDRLTAAYLFDNGPQFAKIYDQISTDMKRNYQLILLSVLSSICSYPDTVEKKQIWDQNRERASML